MKKLWKLHLISILCYIVFGLGGLLVTVLVDELFYVWCSWISAIFFVAAPMISATNRLRGLKTIKEIKPNNAMEERAIKIFLWIIPSEIFFSIFCSLMLITG